MKIFASKWMAFSGVLVLSGLWLSPCIADEGSLPVIHPSPNKSECKSAPLTIDQDTVTAELCVTQASFAHDNYKLKINDSTVLMGIDDQTTTGISTSYNGKPVSLRCAPQLVNSASSINDIRKIVPMFSDQKINELKKTMVGIPIDLEVARLCSILVENITAMKIQIVF